VKRIFFFLSAVVAGVALGIAPMLFWPTASAVRVEVVSLDQRLDGTYSALLSVRNAGERPVTIATSGVWFVDDEGNSYNGNNPQEATIRPGGDQLIILGGTLPAGRRLRVAVVMAPPAAPIIVRMP
jgi:hypothetical protein